MINRRSPSVSRLCSVIVLAHLVATLTSSLHAVYAQTTGGDVFSSDSGTGKTWWDVKRRDYPDCTGLVDQHQEMTTELYRLDAEAKQAVEPQRKQIVQQINDLSRQRTQVQRKIFACIRTSGGKESTVPPFAPDQDRVAPNDSARDDTIRAQEILTPQGKKLLFQLGAEMNEIAKNQGGHSDAGSEFLGGLAEWAGETIQFLAQRPGAPVEQTAKGIMDYLTNDNAANHRALRAAAEEALRDFQKNPARFLGKNLPDLLPAPGIASNKARALQRIAQVEKGANRVKRMTDAEKKLERFYKKVGPSAEGYGANVQEHACFAINSCVDEALAEAQLFKTGGPIGDGTPWKIVGTRGLQTPKFPDAPSGRPPLTPESQNWPKGMPYDPNQPLLDLRHTPEQLYAKLKPYGDNFAPRRPGTYNPEQLDMIWNGRPIPMEGPEHIAKILEREGIGSQGLVIAEYKRPKGNVSGHMVNFQNPDGTVAVVDRTGLRMDVSEVESWLFFPIY
jgi:hypothetical protein